MSAAPAAGEVRAVGDAALLVAARGPGEARSLAAAVSAAGWPGVREVTGGLRSVLVTVEPAGADLEALAAQVALLDPGSLPPPEPRTHRLPVVFDGPDVDRVCRHAGVGAEELVELLAGATLRVALLGFSPGFGYLTGLPEPLRSVARRAVPRRSVPAGSVAVAGGFAAVYPQATPGGWQLVGRTSVRLWDPSVPPYALLRPGDTVRLVPVDTPGAASGAAPSRPIDVAGAPLGAAPSAPVAPSPPLAPTPTAPGRPPRSPIRSLPGSRATFVVEDPGILTMGQDGGRPGMARLGVPRAGPADPLAHALANRLVGNRPDAAALEVTARGPVLRCEAPAYVAVAGGDVAVSVDGREVGCRHVLPVAPGQRLAVGAVRAGLRAYLAVAGGLALPEVLGSCSTDVLTWLGPGPLVAGDELGIAGPPGPMADHLVPGAPGWGAPGWTPPAGPPSRRILRILPGPHPEWFPEGTFDRLAGQRWVVDGASDRVGLRLRPQAGSQVDRYPGELDSQGMVTGAVQIPPGGAPVVLGPDHATLGGYPVVAVVASADLWVLGQCPPGEEVELVPVTPMEAARALDVLGRAVAGAVVGRYPVASG